MSDNNIQGRKFLVSRSDDEGTTLLTIGGVQSRNFTVDNNVADNTNSATQGDYTENCWTGYSAVSASLSGVVDLRKAADTATFYELLEKGTSGNRQDFLNFADGNGFEAEGEFVITSINQSADQQGFINFEMNVQSAEDVLITVTPPVPTP